MESSNFLYSFV